MLKRRIKSVLAIGILLGPLLWVLLWKFGTHNYKKLAVLGTVELNGDTTPWTIADFQFINQNGDSISSSQFKNKIYIANFFFASCKEVCPTMNKNMHIVYEKFKNHPDILFLSHTVDPENDTVAALKKYAQKFNIKLNNWHFVTGNKNAIYQLAEKSYKAVTVKVDSTTDFIHSEKLVLVDKQNRIRGIYNGLDFKEVKELMDAIVILIKEYKDSEKL